MLTDTYVEGVLPKATMRFASEACHQLFFKVTPKYAVLGVSPFNSYFSIVNLKHMLRWAEKTCDDYRVYIPTELSYHNFLALGYPEARAEKKTRRQDQYCLNKIMRAFTELGFHPDYGNKKIITTQWLSNCSAYIKIKADFLNYLDIKPEYKRHYQQAVCWVLSQYMQSKTLPTEALDMAFHYLASEMPLFLDAPCIFAWPNAFFVYHQLPEFIRALYNDRDCPLLSKRQGFINLQYS